MSVLSHSENKIAKKKVYLYCSIRRIQKCWPDWANECLRSYVWGDIASRGGSSERSAAPVTSGMTKYVFCFNVDSSEHCPGRIFLNNTIVLAVRQCAGSMNL